MDFDKELDARGLSCPLPILKTKKSLNELTSGQVLKVVATDPGSVKDMQAFANQTGHTLVSVRRGGQDVHVPHPEEVTGRRRERRPAGNYLASEDSISANVCATSKMRIGTPS